MSKDDIRKKSMLKNFKNINFFQGLFSILIIMVIKCYITKIKKKKIDQVSILCFIVDIKCKVRKCNVSTNRHFY